MTVGANGCAGVRQRNVLQLNFGRLPLVQVDKRLDMPLF
jgi:hypothetical protein